MGRYGVVILLVLVVVFVVVTGVRYGAKNYFGENRRFYDNPYRVFPCLEMLADNHAIIEKEYIEGKYRMYDWPEKYLAPETGDEWKVVPLYGFGVWNQQYESAFPETIRMLKKIPGLRTAIFSSLGPGTELKKHQGWASLANEVLRCHMGIIVPSGGRSGVEVEDEFRQVANGEWIVFDDSKTHIGVNNTDQVRTVLLLDIERPWWVKKGKSQIGDTVELQSFMSNFDGSNGI